MTQFSTWKTDGSRMRKRVQRAKDFLTPADMKVLNGKHPAINIGVMGWSKPHIDVITDWENMTVNLAGQHIADEVACQVIYHRHPHVVVGPEWNESCNYNAGKVETAKILHFHGNKHCGYRISSFRWLKHFAQMLEKGVLDNPDLYLTWRDKALTGLIHKHKNWRHEILTTGRIKG